MEINSSSKKNERIIRGPEIQRIKIGELFLVSGRAKVETEVELCKLF